MLGSEYNWLISLTPAPHGQWRVRMAGTGVFTLSVAFCCAMLAVWLLLAPGGDTSLARATEISSVRP